MKKNYQRAFDPERLAGDEMAFDMDSGIIKSMMIIMGQEIPSDFNQKARKDFDLRMEACMSCPEFVLAVWGEKTP